MRFETIMAPVALALLLGGCASVASEDVRTSGLYADLEARSDGDGTRATAVLRVGGATSNTFVQLSGDDVLTATCGGDTKEMQVTSVGNIYSYIADFDSVDEDTEVTIAFERTVDAGAPESTMTLPAGFEILEPEDNTVHPRSEDVLVTWEPSGSTDDLRIRVEGDCFQTWEDGIPDTGSTLIPPLEGWEGQEGVSCNATVSLNRRRAGSLDPGYGEGGSIWGIQTREVSYRADP